MQTQERQSNEWKGLPHTARDNLSGRSEHLDPSLQSSFSATTKRPVTSPVVYPVTHLAAGMSVPISQSLKARFGVDEEPVDRNFIDSIDIYFEFLKIAIKQEWLSPVEVSRMISNHTAGSPAQSKECYSLINKCLDHISDEAKTILEPVKLELESYDFVSGNGGGWEISFGFVDNEDIFDFDIPFATNPALVSAGSGLCVLVNDYSFIPESLRFDVTQLIYFCSDISYHATTIDMVLDDMLEWMILGDVADVKNDGNLDLEFIESAKNEEKLEEVLKKHFGEDFIDELCVSMRDIADYYLSVESAKKIYSNLKPLSKVNVSTFLKRISKSVETPPWLLSATKLLLNNCQWDIDMTEHVRMHGHIPFGFLNPTGFGFPIETHMFKTLHEMSMMGEEVGSLSVEFGNHTAKVLANLELGESMLLFVDQKLQNEYSKEI